MHAATPPATKPCHGAVPRFRITSRARSAAVTSPPLLVKGPVCRMPDLADPQIRALPIAVLALAFALAGDRGAIR